MGTPDAKEAPLITVRGGQISCGSWLEEREKKSWSDIVNQGWVAGYLSGVAYTSQVDLLVEADAAAVAFWVDNYCRREPLSQLIDAANALSAELAKKASVRVMRARK